MACRVNKKRLWTHRMILESFCHPSSVFVTLTYSPENLPPDLSVHPEHVQLFLKRLRKAIYPKKIRFFAVGEYGDKSWRPHYHLAIFNLSVLDTDIIRSTWSLGHVMVGEITSKSAGYIAGYCTKKMTKENDERLNREINGIKFKLNPEFTRMSLKPGIGAPALDKILDILTSKAGVLPDGDVPKVLRHGDKIYPLGRYLRNKLRDMYAFKDEYIELLKAKSKEEMFSMLDDFLDFKAVRTEKPIKCPAIEMSWRNPQQDLNIKSRLNLRSRRL